MMVNENNPPIIIVTKINEKGAVDYKSILMSIATRALSENKIFLHVVDKHLPTAEKLLKFLRRFGWIETDRKEVNSFNTLCIYSVKGLCTNEQKNFKGPCTEAMKSICGFYKRKLNQALKVNQITIEPIPGIRSLD